MIKSCIITSLFFIFFYTSCKHHKPAPLSTLWDLPYNDKPFNDVAQDILKQTKIYEMDDGSRSIKLINGVFVRLTKQLSEEDSIGYLAENAPKFIIPVLDSLKIPPALYEALRQKLYDTQLYSFYKSHDTLLFIVNGFLSTDWGYLYTPNKLNNDTDDFHVGKYEVHFTKNVNNHWKRVAVH